MVLIGFVPTLPLAIAGEYTRSFMRTLIEPVYAAFAMEKSPTSTAPPSPASTPSPGASASAQARHRRLATNQRQSLNLVRLWHVLLACCTYVLAGVFWKKGEESVSTVLYG